MAPITRRKGKLIVSRKTITSSRASPRKSGSETTSKSPLQPVAPSSSSPPLITFPTSASPDLLQLLAQQQQQITQQQQQMAQQQSLLTEIAQRISQPQFIPVAGISPPQPVSTPFVSPPPPTKPSHQPPIVRGLTTPKLSSADSTTIPQFRDWKQRWEDYAKAQQLYLQSIDTQHGVLRSALDSEWTMLWNSGRIPITVSDPLQTIIFKLEQYLRSRRNPLLDRQLFIRRDQMSGESVDRYYAALKSLDDASAHDTKFACNSCPAQCDLYCYQCQVPSNADKFLQETRIRDRLICGLQDKEMQKKVLAEPFSTLTLQKVLSICAAVENSNATGDTLSSPHSEQLQAFANRKSTYKQQQVQSNRDSSQTPSFPRIRTEDGKCGYCGDSDPHPKSDCRASNVKCDYCGIIGHLQRMCLRKKRESPPQETSSDGYRQRSSPPPTPPVSGHVSCNASAHELLPVHTFIAGNPHLIHWLPDSGSEVDAISEDDFRKLGPRAHNAATSDVQDVIGANGLSLGPVGSVRATLKLNGKEYATTLRIFRNLTTPLLSKRGCVELGLLNSNWPSPQVPVAGAISRSTPSAYAVQFRPPQRPYRHPPTRLRFRRPAPPRYIARCFSCLQDTSPGLPHPYPWISSSCSPRSQLQGRACSIITDQARFYPRVVSNRNY